VAWKCSACLLTQHRPYKSSKDLCYSPSIHTIIKRQQTSYTTIQMLQSRNLVSGNFPPQLGKKVQHLETLPKVLSVRSHILVSFLLSLNPLSPEFSFKL
jgi:hypothetical protein